MINVLKQIIDKYSFHVLLKMDTDALVIGDHILSDILTFFKANPKVGIVGAFKKRGDGTNKEAAMARKGTSLPAK